jgi:uncharacterized protein (TIGR02246 family)
VTGEALAELLAEREVRGVIARYARGIDRLDMELVRSCYWPDATDVHGTFTGSRDGFIAWVEPLLQRHTMTMHHLAEVLVDLHGDSAAVETYGVAYHSGEPSGDLRWNYAAGFRYADRFERRDGAWRIADRVTVVEWVTPWDVDTARTAIFGRLASRSEADPIYAAGARRAVP